MWILYHSYRYKVSKYLFFQLTLAHISTPSDQRRNLSKEWNYMPFAEAVNKWFKVPFHSFTSQFGFAVYNNSAEAEWLVKQNVVIPIPDYFDKLNEFLSTSSMYCN